MAHYSIPYSIGKIKAISIIGEKIHYPQGVDLMLKGRKTTILAKLADYPFPSVTKWSMAKVMAHAHGPGKLSVQTQGTADGGSNGGNMQHMLHTCADMVVGWSIEDLGLMLKTTEGG